MFFVGAYKISQFEKDFTEYDPYAVLELDRVSHERLLESLLVLTFLTLLEISSLCVCSLYPPSLPGWYTGACKDWRRREWCCLVKLREPLIALHENEELF